GFESHVVDQLARNASLNTGKPAASPLILPTSRPRPRWRLGRQTSRRSAPARIPPLALGPRPGTGVRRPRTVHGRSPRRTAWSERLKRRPVAEAWAATGDLSFGAVGWVERQRRPNTNNGRRTRQCVGSATGFRRC